MDMLCQDIIYVASSRQGLDDISVQMCPFFNLNVTQSWKTFLAYGLNTDPQQ